MIVKLQVEEDKLTFRGTILTATMMHQCQRRRKTKTLRGAHLSRKMPFNKNDHGGTEI